MNSNHHQGQIISMDATHAITTTFIMLLFISFTLSSADNTNQIPLGSSLYPVTHPTSWLSPSGLFAFGFYQQGSGFAIGIWLVGRNNNTVVWTANRDDPPVASNSKLELTMEGKLVLQTQEEEQQEKLIIIAANANATTSSASMLDSGNFVLYSKNSSVMIWQSFDHPTDTMLGDQTLASGGQLVSSSSKTNHSSGKFVLQMKLDGDLVLCPAHTTCSEADVYLNIYGNGFGNHLYLNKTGNLLIRKDNVSMPIIGTSYDGSSLDSGINNVNNMTIYRATVDVDGFFRLYAHDRNDPSNSSKVANLPLVENGCWVNGFCGFNSYCTSDDQKAYCQCLPGFDFIDSNQETNGCKRSFREPKCREDHPDENDNNTTSYNMVPISNLVWDDEPYFAAQMSQKEECSSSCLADCNCWAAVYLNSYHVCMKHQSTLRYVIRTGTPCWAFVKVGNKNLNETIHRTPELHVPDDPPTLIKSNCNKSVVVIIMIILSFALILSLTIGISSHYIYKIRVVWYKRVLEIGELGINEEVALRRFSYSELKKATNGFKQELGKGNFGAVYKGALYRGKSMRLIAVKRLEKLVEEGEREFQAEMRAIGKTHHRNLVRLLGFCADGPKRLLVYEYMSNGSLGNLIFGNANVIACPDWEERARIALDIARGILYLHEECESPIIHCDIKPQNILMDDSWTAKISDFGLAKLLMPDQTRTFTGVRGTRGYLAPEWQRNAPITVKADTYSYGIVLLETLCCRRNLEVNISQPEEILLSTWAYQCFVSGELHKLVHWEVVDKNVLENMVKVALWCIQDEPVLRPSMRSVVMMLEGITEVAIPPCPTSYSM